MTHVSGLYIHVPFCRHLCNYCDFYKKRFDSPVEQIEEFHRSLDLGLIRHHELMKDNDVTWEPLETVYLGGGTPSLWGSEGAEYFRRRILKEVALMPGAEFTMEVDPGTWTAEMLRLWQALGMNRISIGTQALNSDFLKIMDRNHTLEESLSLLTYCRDHDLNFSLDFLLGLPFSKEKFRDIEREILRLLEFRPKHVSLYILNARSKYPYISAMPDDDFIREEYLLVSDLLRSHGFHHYEVSNFALPGFESRHNMKYWRSESVAALGPTGTGLFAKGEDKGLRYKWKVSSAEVELEELGKEELELESTYLELRTSAGWKPRKQTPELLDHFEKWSALRYGNWDGVRMRLNSLGFLMLDSLMDDLFRVGLSSK
jgi:oxygen-independent coproporphyrinogen-3 oxidase